MRTHLTYFASLLICGLLTAGLPAVGWAQEAGGEQPAGATETPAAKAGDLTGTWVYTFEGRGGQTREGRLMLKQDGENLTGTVSGWGDQQPEISEGKVVDGVATWKVVREFNGQEFTTNYTARLEGDTLMVTSTFTGRDGEERTREYQAKRQAPATQPTA